MGCLSRHTHHNHHHPEGSGSIVEDKQKERKSQRRGGMLWRASFWSLHEQSSWTQGDFSHQHKTWVRLSQPNFQHRQGKGLSLGESSSRTPLVTAPHTNLMLTFFFFFLFFYLPPVPPHLPRGSSWLFSETPGWDRKSNLSISSGQSLAVQPFINQSEVVGEQSLHYVDTGDFSIFMTMPSSRM